MTFLCPLCGDCFWTSKYINTYVQLLDTLIISSRPYVFGEGSGYFCLPTPLHPPIIHSLLCGWMTFFNPQIWPCRTPPQCLLTTYNKSKDLKPGLAHSSILCGALTVTLASCAAFSLPQWPSRHCQGHSFPFPATHTPAPGPTMPSASGSFFTAQENATSPRRLSPLRQAGLENLHVLWPPCLFFHSPSCFSWSFVTLINGCLFAVAWGPRIQGLCLVLHYLFPIPGIEFSIM